ncbi:MAG: AgmX/PglI C-terminal domain-containing protein [Kofleriaceae bacterium]
MRILAALVLLTGVATADRFTPPAAEVVLAPHLRFGVVERGSIANVAIDIDGNVAKVVIDVTTQDRFDTDVAIPFEFPLGTRATALAVTINGDRQVGEWANATEARARYREIVRRRSDPALLEWQFATRTSERVDLHVFPVASKSPAKVELTLELPGPIAIEPGAFPLALRVEGKLRTWKRFDTAVHLALPVPLAPSRATSVTARASLLAGVPLVMRAESRYSQTPRSEWANLPNKTGIRRAVRLSAPRLTHCYELAVQRQDALHEPIDSEAVMRFRILANGAVANITVEGMADGDATACIAKEIASWSFANPEAIPIEVNYPLHLKLAGS